MEILFFPLKFILGALFNKQTEKVKNWFFNHKIISIIIILPMGVLATLFYFKIIEIAQKEDEKVLAYKLRINPIKNPKYKSDEINDAEKNQNTAINPEILGLNNECSNASSFCSTFADGDWVGWPAFEKNKENPRILKIINSRKYDNPNLFYRKLQPGVNFDFELRVVPKNSNKGNIVIAHNKLWRCIVGESNYNTVTCETGYTTKNKKRFVKHLSSEGKKPINPDTAVVIKGSTLLDSKNLIKLNLFISYINNEDQKDNADMEFILPSRSPDSKQTAEVGVGIIDVYNEGIEVDFQVFRLTPR